MTAARAETSLRLAMRLPRVAGSVTTARHRLERALAGIGVTEECRDDIALALTEACSNAVEHAQIGHEYVVVVTVDRTRCIVEVVDTGVGMDVERLNGHRVPLTATRGRGLQLIRAVTDGLEMRRVDPHGLAVRMTKSLIYAGDAPRCGPASATTRGTSSSPENRTADLPGYSAAVWP